MPKANVSRAVARLETDYGVALVERTTRRILLTEIGKKLHERCYRLLAEIEAANAEIANYRGEPSGTLRIGCPSSVAVNIAPHLAEFLDLYPAIDLRLKVADRLLPEPAGFDVVLHAGWLADSFLVARKLVDIPTVLVASRSYTESYGLPARPEELGDHRVINNLFAEDRSVEAGAGALPARVPPIELVRGRDTFTVPSWTRFASNDPAVMLDLVQLGFAIAPLSEAIVADRLAGGDFVRVLPAYRLVEQPALYAVYAGKAAAMPKVRAFIDFVVDKAKKSAVR